MACYQSVQNASRFCVCFSKSGRILRQPTRKLVDCKCVQHQHEVNKTRLIGTVVPQCEEDGTYSRKQCHLETGYCWCTDAQGLNRTTPVRGEELNCA
ncbi:U24-ctenitoxin-Pn1a-like protein [Dinothrombium tinctorium]|uniref:U24-ctenitoxin-Pn1a-like protein n=1 Tax=Dinothrombium tinctorium TaxID=1965070 RepID=A0A3S3PCG1_9ACAR|nr:U24-ctenitoxin-Pn1a-like protein [Dinothrombium tinctorium]RWS05730.1 U24-ctenitoxin-Pn1a-like protein [Dinothrombium tinctorium]RWS06430.1 U24-ctenitoxin-Pn1a-like protein [Dinothrombium tinctorium]